MKSPANGATVDGQVGLMTLRDHLARLKAQGRVDVTIDSLDKVVRGDWNMPAAPS
jgi:hypothetical protein